MENIQAVYIAGKITGDRNYRAKFSEARAELYGRGFTTVINPAMLPEGLRPSDYMDICSAMLRSADVVAFLCDWEESPGAVLEHAYAAYVGKELLYL
ncbi:MAG: DUF4406 domain-containing protein [Oscillospiraceae bacterium]